eukprot:5591793-Alexandrium_andersonii.AAC.1
MSDGSSEPDRVHSAQVDSVLGGPAFVWGYGSLRPGPGLPINLASAEASPDGAGGSAGLDSACAS